MYRLVIVDDELETRNGLANYYPWADVGFSVQAVFDNGEAAFEYLQSNDTDVLLTDIFMPIMDGLELAQKLFYMPFSGKIVFFSIHRDFEFAQKGMAFGVRYYISKPSRYSEITEIFTRLKEELDARNKGASNDALSEVPDVEDCVTRDVKQYVDTHYQYTSLYDTAAHVNMNPSYLSKFFKIKTGLNFSDYLLHVRMEKAADFLLNSRRKIYEISEMVGYGTSKSLMRVFKNYYGVTPKHYRNGTQIPRARGPGHD